MSSKQHQPQVPKPSTRAPTPQQLLATQESRDSTPGQRIRVAENEDMGRESERELLQLRALSQVVESEGDSEGAERVRRLQRVLMLLAACHPWTLTCNRPSPSQCEKLSIWRECAGVMMVQIDGERENVSVSALLAAVRRCKTRLEVADLLCGGE